MPQTMQDRLEAARASLPHFGISEHHKEDPRRTVEHYRQHFAVLPERYGVGAKLRTVADIGTGYGWLAIALALFTPYHVIAADADPRRLRAARQIAAIFDVEQRIEWVSASVTQLPFRDRELDAVFCVETLEHVPAHRQGLRELARVTDKFLVVTTPNRLFPIIGHDTVLPFCHWLPLPMRDRYARLFGRLALQEGNLFLTPGILATELPDFTRVSRFLQFPSYRDYRDALGEPKPHLSALHQALRRVQRAYMQTAALAGRGSIYLLPNIASAYVRGEATASG